MSTGRYVLGGAAVAGAAYYLYAQRLEQAQTPAGGIKLPAFGSSSNKTEGTGERTGRKLDEAVLNARDRLDDLSHETGKSIDRTLASAEQQRSKFNGWASDKLEDAQDHLDKHADSAKKKADQLAKQAHRDDPGRIKQFGQEVKDTFEDATTSVNNSLHNAKQSIVGTKDSAEKSATDAKEKVKDSVEDAKDKASGWFSRAAPATSEEELARRSKLALEGWGETAAANANEYYDSVASKPSSSSSWFGWGRSKDTQEAAQEAYDSAKKSYEDAKAHLRETSNSWFSFKEDPEKKRLHAEAEKQLEAAQKQYDAATSKLNEWKERAQRALSTNGTTTKHYDGFYDWLRGGYPYLGSNRSSADTIRGWGKSAQDAANEQYYNSKQSVNDLKRTYNDAADEVSRSTKDWTKWFNRKYAETAQGAKDYYNDANSALADAQKELDAQTSHWWSWGKKTSKDLELQAKKDVEEAQRRVNDATNQLSKWGIDTQDKLLKVTEDALKQTRDGLNKANEKTQEGLKSAQSWTRDQQK
ncbi:CYFA0S04e05050g1_1 [Cyberlindnera fabianii]|uniref:CYFA0S04e05050g1_1 n=1 Tax=Cyberlindnera fabianii TaxID=36022 RepID=A0A061AZJ1_CYBFA|nr:CYFA0S04e05050g1_1 [Cyberlindnera fabianii]